MMREGKMSEPSKAKAALEEMLILRDHLEAILFRFVDLYERSSEDRKMAVKQGDELATLVKGFTEQVHYLEAFEEKVRGEIKASIATEAKHTAYYYAQTLGDTVKKEVEPSVLKLQEAVNKVHGVLSYYDTQSNVMYWASLFTTVIAAVVTSLCIVKFIMPPRVMPLTDAQMSTYHLGMVLDNAWPKLTYRQQKWIVDVAGGKIKNDEKLVAEVKKNNV